VSFLSGDQYPISFQSVSKGELNATVAQVGASLRQMSVGDIQIVQEYDADQSAPFCAGVVMAPWTNRIKDGIWLNGDKSLQFEIDLASQGHANHGLLLDYPYILIRQTPSSVTLGATINSFHAYPFQVETTVTYELGEAGLTVTHTAMNCSELAAPYAVGAHPYFRFSGVSTQELTVSNQATTTTTVDHRQIPIGEAPTLGSALDLRDGVRVGSIALDNDFTDLVFDANGHAHTYLLTAKGSGLDVWQDTSFKHVVIFTTDDFPTASGATTLALAIEPSTAAPNAFNSGKDLMFLKQGELFTAKWGVFPLI
jgi:aldose 1-epimerase